jgi:hypothetical protein
MQTQQQSGSKSNNTPIVPQAMAALDQMKFEVAQELGIQLPQDGYYGHMATRDVGHIGGNMTRKLVQIAEQTLAGQYRH